MTSFFDYLNRRNGGEQELGRLAQRQALLERIRQLLESARPFLDRYSGIEAELTALMENGQVERVEALLRDLPARLQAVDRHMEEVRQAEVLVPSADVGKNAFYAFCLREMKTGNLAEAARRKNAVLERIRQVNEAELARREREALERAHRAQVRQEKTRLGRIPELVFFKEIRVECCETVDRNGVEASRQLCNGILPALRELKDDLVALAGRKDIPAPVKSRVPDLWNYCVSSLRSAGIQDARNRCGQLNREADAFLARQEEELRRVDAHPLVSRFPQIARELKERIGRGELDGDGWSLTTIANQLDGLKKWQTYWASVTPATPEIATRKAELDRFCAQQMGCDGIVNATMRYVSLFSQHLAVIISADATLSRFKGVTLPLLEMLRANKCVEVEAELRRIRQPLSDLNRLLEHTRIEANRPQSSFRREYETVRKYCETEMTGQEMVRAKERVSSLMGKIVEERSENDRRMQREEEERRRRTRMWIYIGLGLLAAVLVLVFIWYLFAYVLDTWWKIVLAVIVVAGIVWAIKEFG
jgi:hypothetical protein